jgi:hypothetical protein
MLSECSKDPALDSQANAASMGRFAIFTVKTEAFPEEISVQVYRPAGELLNAAIR